MKTDKGEDDCRQCIDCERMIDFRELLTPREKQKSVSWRCYGQYGFGELKRDISKGKQPPKESPMWCPHRAKLTIFSVATSKDKNG